MRKTIHLLAAVMLLLVGGAAFAQESYDGPDEADIMAEIGAPEIPTGEMGPTIVRPAVPGIPAEARAEVPDQDFVEIFCLTTRGKMAAFYAALDALEEHLLPAVTEASALAGPFSAPDVASLRAGAESRLSAVCEAGSVEQAIAETDALVDYGESAQGQFSALRDDMIAKLKAKGDEMRARIESRVRPLAESEKARAQAELDAMGERLGGEAQSSLEAEMSGRSFGSVEEAQSYVNSRINALKANIMSQVQARADVLKKEIEARMRAEADSAAGPDREKFEALGAKLGKLGDTINAAVAAGEASGAADLAAARAKRKSIVLAVVDRKVEQALRELEDNRDRIDEARAADPEIKSVEGIRAELAADRAVLVAALDSALAQEDEAAFDAAIGAFRDKWEGYRANVEQAFYSVTAICGKAGERLGTARSRLDAGYKEIADLQARCASSVSEECLRINGFASRFAAVLSKMDDVNARLTDIEAACRPDSGTDVEALLGMLTSLKTAGDALDAYGQAFQAEKQKVMAESAADMCAQVLPQLAAARVELRDDDLAALKSNLDRCRGSQTEECSVVNAVSGEYDALKSAMDAFLADASKFETMCGQAIDEARFLEMRDLAMYLKSRGDALKIMAEDLKVKQSEKASMTAVCAAAVPRLGTAKKEIAQGVSDASSTLAACKDRADARCTAINAAAGRITEVTGRAEALLKRVTAALSKCDRPAGEADAAFLEELTAIRAEEKALKDLVAELKAEGDSAWPERIKSGQPFKFIIDVSPTAEEDAGYTGDWRTDPLGTIKGGETYTLTYSAARGWSATGLNEGTGRVGTWTYRYGDPDAYELDLWGRVFKFGPDGSVYDTDLGLSGHLIE